MLNHRLCIKIASMPLLVSIWGCSTISDVKQACVPVKVPVYYSCDVQKPTKPDNLFDKTNKQDYLTVRVKALMLDRVTSKDYEQELEQALDGCIAPRP